jgi:hypothetical protein
MGDFDKIKDEAKYWKDSSLMSAIGSGGGFSTIDPAFSARNNENLGSVIKTNF